MRGIRRLRVGEHVVHRQDLEEEPDRGRGSDRHRTSRVAPGDESHTGGVHERHLGGVHVDRYGAHVDRARRGVQLLAEIRVDLAHQGDLDSLRGGENLRPPR